LTFAPVGFILYLDSLDRWLVSQTQPPVRAVHILERYKRREEGSI